VSPVALSLFQPPEAHYGDFDPALLSELHMLIKSAVKGLLGISISVCPSNNTPGSKAVPEMGLKVRRDKVTQCGCRMSRGRKRWASPLPWASLGQ